MLPVEQPFKTYTGKDGKPLNNGYVYFGLPNQNPITAPVQVYWDPEGTIPAYQPLRTENGYIVRAGTPANVFFDGVYSQLVQDSKKRQVFYAKTSNEFSTTSTLQTFFNNISSNVGAALLGYIADAVGAVKRTVLDVLREELSILDFMNETQKASFFSGGTVDHTSALQKAKSFLQSGNKSLKIPAGTLNFSETFDVPAGACVRIDPKAVLNFTSTASPVIRIRRGVHFHGNLAALNMTNAAWDGDAILLDGSDQFVDTYPTFVSGLRMNSASAPKGTMLHLQAVNAREFISFVHLRDFSAGANMKYALVLSCGNSGTVEDNSTWHWINSNVFENFTSFAKYLMSVVGLNNVPAEVAANQFLNFHHQAGDNPGLPVYFYGACNNTFTGWIWDWDNSTGSPIVFDGGARWNSIKSNVDTSVPTTAQQNKVEDMTGGETGQKYFWAEVLHFARTYFGRLGASGKYAVTFLPDTAGGTPIHIKNELEALQFIAGPDPYVGDAAFHIRADSTVVAGANYSNPTISALRVNGAPNRSARATRMGADGFAADLYENSAGTTVGSIVVTTSSTTYNTASDYRLKDQVAPLTGSGDFIDKLRPVSWVWKIDGTRGSGFIAHELQGVSSSSVTGTKDAMQDVVGENGEVTGRQTPLYQAVEYGSAEVIANMVSEIQSLRKRIASLESKN